MTDEERLAAFLADQEPYVDPLMPLPEPEPEPVATEPEPLNSEKFLVVSKEDIERDELAPLPDDPLRPLPDDPLAPEPEAKPMVVSKEEIERDQKPEDKPKDQPLVATAEEVTRFDGWVQRAAERRRAEIAAQQANTTAVEVEPEQAVYARYLEEAINTPDLWKATPEDFNELSERLAAEVFGDKAKPTVTMDQWKLLAEYRAKGGTSPSKVSLDGLATTEDPNADPTFTESLIKGGATTMQLGAAAKEAVFEVLGVDATEAGQQRRYYQGLSEVLPEGVKLGDIEDIGDALQWAKQTLGEQGALMAAPMSGAIVGGIVKGSLGATLGAFGPSWTLGVGEVQSSNKQINPDQKAGLATLAGGTVIATLDSVLPGRIGSRLVAAVGTDNAERIARRILLSPADEGLVAAARRITAEGLKSGGIEMPTEASQTAIGEIATAVETGTPIQPGMINRLVESAVTGGFMGTVAGGTAQAASEIAAARPTDALSELRRSKVVQPARPVAIDPEERPAKPVRVAPTPKPVSSEGVEQEFRIPGGKVTSRFGPRKSFRTANGAMASTNHAGIDIALPSGAPVLVGADGIIVGAGPNKGYGNQVVVQHSDGTTSSYSHLSRIGVKVGQQVAQDDVIGKVGKTGNATGPHLHLERRNRQGVAINPLTGGPVMSMTDQDGQMDDDTEWEVDQQEIDYFYDDMAAQDEIDSAYEAATGQRFEEEEAAPEGVEIPEAASPTLPREEGGSAVRLRDDEAIPQPIRESPVPDREAVASAARERLDLAQTQNPARAALEEVRAFNEARATPADVFALDDDAPRAGRDWTQQQAGEEPVFVLDESGNATQEVAAFVNTQTGVSRAIGEPPTTQSSAVIPVAAEGQPGADPLPPAAPTPDTPESGLARLGEILAAMPPIPPSASSNVRAARSEGRRVGLGMVDPLTDEQLAQENKSYQTAYNVGLKEGQAAKPEDFVATSTSEVDTTPEMATGSQPAEVISDDGFAEAMARKSLGPDLTARLDAGREEQRLAEIDAKVDEIEDKLFDLETEGTKSQVKAYMLKLVRQGIIPQAEIDALSYMFKDRDMGVEDVTSEVRFAINEWREAQRGVTAPLKGKARLTEEDKNERGNKKGADEQPAQARPIQQRGGVLGSAEPVALDRRKDTWFDKPLPGQPKAVSVPGYGKVAFGPYAPAQQAAADYMASIGRKYIPQKFAVALDEGRATRLAKAFEAMDSNPNDPQTNAAYRAMIEETIAQYRVIEKTGLQIEFIDFAKTGDPYAATPRLAQIDVAENNHLWVFKTDDGYGGTEEIDVSQHPMLELTDIVIGGHRLRVNDVFRIVHDYFGHIKDGHGFRARGEENAWQSHAQMYSPLARRAMTSETRGQNSWVNYGPFGEKNRSATSLETEYAPQKVGLLPPWASEEGYLGSEEEANGRVGRDDGAAGQGGRGRDGSPTATAERGAGEAGPASEERVGDTPPVDADGNVAIQHFTLQEGLAETDPNQWGKSSKFLPEEERRRIGVAPGRTYFGIGTGKPGGYVNEFRNREGGEGYVHPRFRSPVYLVEAKIPLARLYDMNGDPDGLKEKGRAMPKDENGRYIYNGKPVDGVSLYELLIRDAGYAGYWIKRLGMVAAVFEPVPVKPVAKPKLRVDEQVRAAFNRAPQRERALNEAREILRQMKLDGRTDIAVQIVDYFVRPGETKPATKVTGEFDRDEMLIRIAAFANTGRNDVQQTLRHEVIHWARYNGVFNTEEWAILAKWAKGQPGLMAWAERNYKGESRDAIIEEAVAEGFARWNSNRQFADGQIAKLFQKLKDVIDALRAALGGAGMSRGQINKMANELFASMLSGEQVTKFDKRRGAKPQFGRKGRSSELSKAMLSGQITPEEHQFYARNAGLKFQKAWHGSPVSNIEQFKLDFLGTGEGAQAFGWGLYFAQKKSVAEWYRNKLVQGRQNLKADEIVKVGGQTIAEIFAAADGTYSRHSVAGYEVADRILNFLASNKSYNGWLDGLHAAADNEFDGWVRDNQASYREEGDDTYLAEIEAIERSREHVAYVFNTLKLMEKGGAKIALKEVDTGSLYQVEVPEETDLLDLDAPIEKQPAKVKKALATVKEELTKEFLSKNQIDQFEARWGQWDNWSGFELQRVLKSMAAFGQLPNTDPDVADAQDAEDAAKAVSVYLRSKGIPGSKYHDRDSRIADTEDSRTSNYVIFDDSLIAVVAENPKFRVIRNSMANSPLSDPTKPDPGIFRRIHDQTMGMLGAIAGVDVDAADNLMDAFRRKVTQRYQQIIKTQRRAAELMGVERLPSGQNPMEMITADERGYKLQYLTDNMIRPMAEEMANRGIEMADLGLYLYARHAPARNARIALINPEFRDPDKPGSGMTDLEAQSILQEFVDDGKAADLAAVATHIDAMIEFAQQERKDGGLLTQEDIDAGFQPGEFYVPLRGNENIEPELEMGFALAAKKGGGFSVAGKEGHRMFGRSSYADLEEIVGYTVTQAQEAIDRAYRNRVAMSMLEMFRAAPDSDFVQIDRVKRVAVWNKAKGQVEYQMQTRMNDPLEQQRTIFVKDRGVIHKMTFNDKNPSAMRFAKAAKNLGAAQLARWMQLISVFTRLWSKSNTQWNIDFILANATKDMQTGVLNATTLNKKGLRRAMIKNLISLRPMAAAWMGSQKNAGAGFGSGNIWFETYSEFEANGGKLNYGQVDPLEDAIRTAKREINNAKRGPLNPIKAGGQLLEWIDHANSAMENMTRLAAYKALRDMGVPAKQAAEAVRELTTNFAQHGEWGPKFNALYGFANASVIGGARFAYTVATNPKIITGLLVLGMMSDMLNHWLDDDEWEEYTEEEKHANFYLLLPDSLGFDIKVPAGYGLNAFVTAGRKMSELWRDKKNKDGTRMSMWDAASDVGMGFVNAFAPINGATFFNVVAPTFADPVVNIYQNQNNFGRRIMPEQPMGSEKEKPDSQLAFENTHQFWKTVAEGMNRLGGGNEVVPAKKTEVLDPFDTSPESYKHVVTETLGGSVRTLMRAGKLVQAGFTGEDVGVNDIPVARRFMGVPYGASNASDEQMSSFYDRLSMSQKTLYQAKQLMLMHGKESKEYQRFRKANEPVIEFAESIQKAGKRLKALNAAENAAERGMMNIDGPNKRDRAAIHKATKFVAPQGKKLTKEQVAKVKEKTKQQKADLATEFNNAWLRDVVGD